jgi:Putative zinc-finger
MPMNCDDAIEFLPWLLNDSLETGEREEVRRHLATCERCRAALNDTQEAWTIFGQHLPGDALVALAYGEAPAGVDPAVAERHLAACAGCAAELELARTSRRLEEDDRIALFPGTRAKQETNAGRDRSWRSAAMAAGITCLLALGGWFHEFQQVGRLAQGSRTAAGPATQVAQVASAEPQLVPRINTGSAELFPVDAERGGETVPQEPAAVVPTSDESTLLILKSASTEAADGPREIEILDEANHVLWGTPGLRRRSAQDPDYRVTLPSGFLKSGAYTIQLYANENGTRTPRESYRIRVE